MRVSVSEPYMLFGSSYRVVHSSLLWISVVQVPIGKFTDAFAELSRDLESFLLSSHSLILAGSCWGPVWMCRLMRSHQVGFQHEGLLEPQRLLSRVRGHFPFFHRSETCPLNDLNLTRTPTNMTRIRHLFYRAYVSKVLKLACHESCWESGGYGAPMGFQLSTFKFVKRKLNCNNQMLIVLKARTSLLQYLCDLNRQSCPLHVSGFL